MFATRVHGRGGQGVVTAAELLSVAAFRDGHEAQAFPTFGSERMGAPVVAFCRIDERPIRVREPIAEPDAVIVLDATLLHHVDVFGGLRPCGWVLVNSVHDPCGLGLGPLVERLGAERVRTVAASDIARRLTGRPLPNLVLLGAFAAATGRVSLGSLEAAVHDRFGASAANAAVLRAGHEAMGVPAVA